MNTFTRAAAIGLTVCILTQSHVSAVAGAEANSVEIVVSKEANELEHFAATELQRYLQRLFGASANLVAVPTQSADAFFLLGASSHCIESKTRPHLSNQGFLLRKTTCMDKPALVIVGGSPAATTYRQNEYDSGVSRVVANGSGRPAWPGNA